MVCKNWNIRTVGPIRLTTLHKGCIHKHYTYMSIVAACTGVCPKNMALGQVVTKIVGHVDTVWETKQVYTRITLKSKYVTIHGINRRKSLKVNLRNSVSSGITI